MDRTVLITGASSGIGYELAKIFAEEGCSLVLLARNEQKLTEMQEQFIRLYGITVKTIIKDLSQPGSSQEVIEELQRENTSIDILINNAGFGLYGLFAEMEPEGILHMIQVNMTALTQLTRLLLPDMMNSRWGKILNVASTASFQPGPLMAVYYASKAYVLSFSEALSNELRGTGVTVTALCPGPTDTGFEKRAGLESSKLFKGVNMDAATVARIGYEGLMKNKTLVIPGVKNRLLAFSGKFLPRELLTRIVRQLQETRK